MSAWPTCASWAGRRRGIAGAAENRPAGVAPTFAADPLRGAVRVLITGLQGFERTVAFARDEARATITQRVRETPDDGWTVEPADWGCGQFQRRRQPGEGDRRALLFVGTNPAHRPHRGSRAIRAPTLLLLVDQDARLRCLCSSRGRPLRRLILGRLLGGGLLLLRLGCSHRSPSLLRGCDNSRQAFFADPALGF